MCKSIVDELETTDLNLLDDQMEVEAETELGIPGSVNITSSMYPTELQKSSLPSTCSTAPTRLIHTSHEHTRKPEGSSASGEPKLYVENPGNLRGMEKPRTEHEDEFRKTDRPPYNGLLSYVEAYQGDDDVFVDAVQQYADMESVGQADGIKHPKTIPSLDLNMETEVKVK